MEERPITPKGNKKNIGLIIIVAVVLIIGLLIVVPIITAIGLYFWVTAFTTTPVTRTTPYVIQASCLGASTDYNGTLFINNIGTKTLPANSLKYRIGSKTGTITHEKLSTASTLSIDATSIGVDLTKGKSGTLWTTGGAAVSFYCKEA
ncbi:hypothetical protein K8R43_03045 [archaeon]|nr:hypothetical protein [archaeon]